MPIPCATGSPEYLYTKAEIDALLSGLGGGAPDWGDIGGALADQVDLQSALNAKATPTDIANAIASLVDSSPGALDTLNELAAALGDDSNFAATMATALAGKANSSHGHGVADITGLGDAATKNVGTGAGDVAAGNHTHPGGGAAIDAWPVGSIFISTVNTNPNTLLGGGTWSAFGAGRVLVGLDAGDTDFDTAEETGGAKTVTLTAAQSGLPQHTHTQNSHNHTQDAHTHTQNAHNHTITDPGHSHGMDEGTTDGSGNFMDRSNAAAASAATTNSATTGISVNNATAVNQNATATNQAATATNQDAGPTDAAQAHSNVQPYIVVYMWKRTA